MASPQRNSNSSSECERKTDSIVTSVLEKQNKQAVLGEDLSRDDAVLGALGYKQQFRRDFTFIESFSVSFSALAIIPGVASTIGFSLGYSGTGGAIWGWLISGLMIQSTSFTIAELCSSMPTAGGLYYASAVLAPEGYGPLCSWITGWSNFFGYATVPCSVNYALAAMLVATGQIAYPDYVPHTWHLYLTLLALLFSQGLITMWSTKFTGWVNKIGAIANVIVFFVVIIWFPTGSVKEPKTNKSSDVWLTFENGTDWSIGWATIMGFVTTVWTMAGYDAPFHLSEECSNANIAGPRAIVMTTISGLIGGWAVIMVIVYTVTDIPSVIMSVYGQPFVSLCLQVLGKNAGLAVISLNMVAQFFAGQALTVTAGRIAFAFSRDRALPGSRYWSRVNESTMTPVWATSGVQLLSALMGLLMFASPVAIGAVFSIGAIAQYTTFTLPVALKVFDWENRRFKPGPWNLGRFSRPMGVIAMIWWCVITPALFFPAGKGKDLTLLTMNWTILLYGGSMFLIMVYYAVSARKWFKGPRITIAVESSSNEELPSINTD